MLTLALETSHRRASVALRLGAESVEHHLDPERAHASDCLALFAKLIEEAGAKPQQIDRIVVGTGPGSYTGLRIGIATALGLARGASAELRGEASGEALMWRELEGGEEGVYLLDARQEELYFAHYRRTPTDVEVLTAPTVITPSEVGERLSPTAKIFGDAKALEIAELDEQARERFVDVPPPSAAALLELGSQRFETLGPQEFDQVLPLYLRPFKAKTRRR